MTMGTTPKGWTRGGMCIAIISAITAVLGLGCDAVHTATEEIRILGGQQDYQHVNVVMISSNLGMCTGTYLGSGRVLTAAHCIPSVSGVTVSVTFFDYATEADKTLQSLKYDTLPDRMNELENETNDLARVFVDDSGVPTGVTGMSVLDGTSGLLEGSNDQLIVVGFGATTAPASDSPGGSDFGTRYWGMVTIAELTDYTASVLKSYSDAVACHGDSGGPLIVKPGNLELLAGVVSIGDCLTDTKFTRADNERHADYISSPWRPMPSPDSGPDSGCNAVGSPAGLPSVALGIAVMRCRRRRRHLLL